MLLDTLNVLNRAGTEALQSTCGLRVQGREVSLVREGSRSFSSLVTLRIKGCALQVVHLGCDTELVGKLEGLPAGPDGMSGLDVLAGDFLSHLLEKFDDRNPRGTVEKNEAPSVTLHTRGLRTFQFRLDTGQGQLFFLAEVPSRTELSIAKGSEFLTSMESIYLPGDWHGGKDLVGREAVDDFLTYLRKTEGDIYLEAPSKDGTATLNSGLLVEICQVDDHPALKLITDFSDPAREVPVPGTAIKASVGIGDRSLEFDLTYLAPAAQELDSGALLPGALFSLPATVSIGQRRRTFRVPVSASIRVEIETTAGQEGASPWSDDESISEVITGRLADLSFSGARIIADHSRFCPGFQKDGRVVCRIHFPDMEEPIQVMGVIRRLTTGPADRNQWRDEIGLEFLVSPNGDRSGLDYLRQFVLEVQRSKLAQRLQVSGS
ncbi:MAG: PilZ domain-containing protein [Candidatus Krumholzibacteria bacterium]|nr:PilZ domain-containing protein [Candidatus Krumholzibacteria bacterium]